MKITHNNTEFEIRENDNDVLIKATPFIVRYKILESEYHSGIDFSLLDEYDKRIKQYEIVIKQLSEKELSEDDKKYLSDTQEKLKNILLEKAENKEAQRLLTLKGEIAALIMNEISGDKEVMKKFFQKILIGDTSKILYDDESYKDLVMSVLTVFFSTLQKTGKPLNG